MKIRWKNESGPRLRIREKGEVCWLTYPQIDACGLVRHGFTTRLGGVSEGIWSSMNLSFTRGDKAEHVQENYRRIADAVGFPVEKIVCSDQTHTTNVEAVTAGRCGEGVLRPRTWSDVDGMVTNVPGVVLATFYADCVPLYFVDPVHKAIGLSHSGWRGTVRRMGQVTLSAMKEHYGTQPEDVLCCIGPSICQDCFEVGEEVILEFQKEFDKSHWTELFYKKDNGRYQLDLWKANEIILGEAGVRKEHIQVTDICTHCNPEYLFSHRTCGNERGNLAAFLSLR